MGYGSSASSFRIDAYDLGFTRNRRYDPQGGNNRCATACRNDMPRDDGLVYGDPSA
jgi:hypothetical protein